MHHHSSILLVSLSVTGLAINPPNSEYSLEPAHRAVLVSQQFLTQQRIEESPPPGCDRTDPPDCEPR